MTGTDDQAAGPEVLYVGGLNRSGSTLADLMLDSLPGHVAVGELFYLWRNGVQHDGLCSCGRTFWACPFWAAVGAEAFGGWDQVDVDEVLRLQALVDRTSAIPRLLAGGPAGAFARAVRQYQDVLVRLYRAVARVAGASVVVDSSKRPSLAYVLVRTAGVKVTVVHVLRDPRGVVNSLTKVVALPPGAALRSEMPRSSTWKASRRWTTVNAMISALGLGATQVVRVRYEDLVADPRAQLVRVLEAEGRTPPPDGFPALTSEGLAVGETHLVAGGRIRLAGGVLALRRDEAWRTEMSPARQRVVSILTAPARLSYGYR